MAAWQIGRGLAAAGLLWLVGCSGLETMYLPAQTVPLQGPPDVADTACTATADAAYYLGQIRDCTARDTLIVFAFSGGGIRSASFGYGALQAAHAVRLPAGETLDRDIDVVSGVSGGSFTAAAFASQRERLFAEGKPDYYRDNFLTHDFFADLVKLYLSPLHWRWLFPYYGTNDEMAKIYAGIDFAGPDDKLFAPDFGTLARKGAPFLVVQATDYGNEQPFTFTQNDFDLICSDVRTYPVGAAIAASSAFPVLFSPIQLVNHHFTSATTRQDAYCHGHRPEWVDNVLSEPEPVELSRLYARAKAVEHYLPAKAAGAAHPGPTALPQYVYLQDGGASDNVALRGITNVLIQSLYHFDGHGRWHDARLCAAGLSTWRKILIVAVDGEAQPSRRVSSLPYLSDLGLILDVTSSTMIDANGFETMLATDALFKRVAQRLSELDCGETEGPKTVQSYFARVSFQDLAAATPLASPAACGKANGPCTVDDIAHSETSLDFTTAEVDALIAAGRSAFACNRMIARFLADVRAGPTAGSGFACASVPPAQSVKDDQDDGGPQNGDDHRSEGKVEPHRMTEVVEQRPADRRP